MNELLKNQIALVTGGTAGIGKAIALKFAEQGAKVVIFGTHLERGEEAVKEITGKVKDSIIQFFQVNTAKTDEVDQAIKKILVEHNQIDVLVNNAGITRDQLLIKMSEEDWDQVLDINLKSCYNTCHALIRSMMKARRGSIINISSVIGLTGNPGQANYAASKAGMIGFSKALAKEVASRNIRVNCIAPGFIKTRMTDEMNQDQVKAILSSIPMGSMGIPDDIAHAALFLASPLARYITGQVLTVDGGMI